MEEYRALVMLKGGELTIDVSGGVPYGDLMPMMAGAMGLLWHEMYLAMRDADMEPTSFDEFWATMGPYAREAADAGFAGESRKTISAQQMSTQHLRGNHEDA